MSALTGTLRQLSQTFSECELWWYLFGAQALIAYGFPRATADIDVTVQPPDDLDAFLESLWANGFVTRVDEPKNFVRLASILPVMSQNGIPVDIVFGQSGLESQILSRVRVIDFGDVSVPVATPEDLIISKVVAGRPQDIEDIRVLHGSCNLEREYILNTLRLLEEALSVSDLVPLFESFK